MNDGNEWTMSVEETALYKEEVLRLKNEYADKIDILCGIELDNNFTGVNPKDFDYVIGSVHQLRKGTIAYEVDYTAEILKKAVDELYNGSFNEMFKAYYDTLADFIVSTDVDVVGHIDLITKFNLEAPLFDESDCGYRKIVFDTIDRIVADKPDIIFEVNTGAMYRVGKKSPYPAAFILRYLKEKGCKLTLTSDSHNRESLDFAFDKAIEIIRDCGFSELYYITSEGWKKIGTGV